MNSNVSKYVVNVDELYHGRTFKNYKELCYVMNWKPSIASDNTGKSQFKELSRYCSYEKKGHKIIINEVYGIVMDKQDNRGGNNTELLEISNNTMTYILSTYAMENDGVYYFSNSRLFYLLGFVNGDYLYGRDNAQEVTEDLKVTYTAYNYFYQNTYLKYRASLKRLLNHMQNQKKISCYNVVMFYKGNNHYVANDHQIAIVGTIESRCMLKLGFEKIQDLYISKKAKEYYKMISECIEDDERLDIDGYYNCYKIIVTDDYKEEIHNHVNELVKSGLSFHELRESMNTKLLNKNALMFENKTNKFNNEIEEAGWGTFDPFKPWLAHISDEKFAKDGKVLFDQFCKLYNEKYTKTCEDMFL